MVIDICAGPDSYLHTSVTPEILPYSVMAFQEPPSPDQVEFLLSYQGTVHAWPLPGYPYFPLMC